MIKQRPFAEPGCVSGRDIRHEGILMLHCENPRMAFSLALWEKFFNLAHGVHTQLFESHEPMGR
jgi:hypothetical protein